jgi:DNA-binding NarL/FixJ family response regulator
VIHAKVRSAQLVVVLMGLQMPEVNGIEATRRILQESPNIRILVVTLFEDDDSVFMALRAGARGYVLKDADEEEMVLSIRALGRGEAIFNPAIATRVLVHFMASPQEASHPKPFRRSQNARVRFCTSSPMSAPALRSPGNCR